MEPEQALEKARGAGATYADVRVETVEENRLSIMDGELRGLVSGTETGFALRVLVKGAWGFASSNDLEPKSWSDALERAVGLAKAASAHVTEPVRLADVPTLRKKVDWKAKRDPRSIAVEEKVELLRRMDEAVRRSPEIRNVTTAYTDATVSKRFLSSEGSDLQWSLVRSVAQAHFTAKKDGQLAGRSTRVGGTKGWELFKDEDPVSKALAAAESTVRALGVDDDGAASSPTRPSATPPRPTSSPPASPASRAASASASASRASPSATTPPSPAPSARSPSTTTASPGRRSPSLRTASSSATSPTASTPPGWECSPTGRRGRRTSTAGPSCV